MQMIKKRGRKPQRGKSRAATITFRVLPEVKTQIAALAEKRGMSTSFCLEELVIEQLKMEVGSVSS